MSVDEKAKEAISMIESQMTDLKNIVARAVQDRDFNSADERLSRWKSRTIRLLSEKVNPIEGKNLEDTRLMLWGSHFDNIQSAADLYDAFLKSLLEELSEHPEDYFTMQMSAKEEVMIPKVP